MRRGRRLAAWKAPLLNPTSLFSLVSECSETTGECLSYEFYISSGNTMKHSAHNQCQNNTVPLYLTYCDSENNLLSMILPLLQFFLAVRVAARP